MKSCINCKIRKPLSEFYKHKRMADGHLNKCIHCHRQATILRYQSQKNSIKFIESRKDYHKKRSQILKNISAKKCLDCKKILSIELFGKRRGSKDGYREYCKNCRKHIAKLDYRKNKERFVRHSRIRKGMVKQATPSWLTKDQLEQMRVIYAKCPKGYHVDHIIPLKGSNSCGLHVPWNLQYLKAEDNLKKYNKVV